MGMRAKAGPTDRRRREFRNYAARFGVKLTSHTVGCIGEMIVCADLLKHGWEVFRSVSPHSGCDLIARRHGKTVELEVRSGYRTTEGTLRYARPNRNCSWDTIAVVLPDGSIEYNPPIHGKPKRAERGH